MSRSSSSRKRNGVSKSRSRRDQRNDSGADHYVRLNTYIQMPAHVSPRCVRDQLGSITRPNLSAGFGIPAPTAPMSLPSPSRGSPASMSGEPGRGVYRAR